MIQLSIQQMTKCSWQCSKTEKSWRELRKSRNQKVNENRKLTRKIFANMYRFEDFEFDRFENKWDRRIEIWRNANLYEISKLWKRIWECMCRRYAKTTTWFDVIANQMNSNSQQTCDIDCSFVFENLRIDDEMSELTIFECKFRLLCWEVQLSQKRWLRFSW